MRRFRIAAVTLNGLLGQMDRNLAAIDRWTQAAKSQGAELVLFPELAVHGHCTPNTRDIAEPVPNGPSVQELCRIAHVHDLIVCAGISERNGAEVFNTQVLCGPTGFIGAQRKIHLSRDENLHYSPGTDLPVFDLGFARVGMSICYDGWSPEVCRILALHGADVLLLPHASRMQMWTDTPESERSAAQFIAAYFRKIFPARAHENACYTIVVNQAGRAGTVDSLPPDHPNQPHHAGGCIVFDPWGDIVAQLPDDHIEEAMLIADLDPEPLAAARAHPNYTIRSRRPQAYGPLSE